MLPSQLFIFLSGVEESGRVWRRVRSPVRSAHFVIQQKVGTLIDVDSNGLPDSHMQLAYATVRSISRHFRWLVCSCGRKSQICCKQGQISANFAQKLAVVEKGTSKTMYFDHQRNWLMPNNRENALLCGICEDGRSRYCGNACYPSSYFIISITSQHPWRLQFGNEADFITLATILAKEYRKQPAATISIKVT